MNFVDSLTKGFTSLSSSIGTIPTLTGVVGTLFSLKGIDSKSIITNMSNANSLIKQYNTSLGSTADVQKEVMMSIAETNPQLATYLMGLKQGDASLSSYGANLLQARLKTIGLTVVTTALNAVISMGIGLLISFGVSLISNIVNNAENSKKALEDLKNEINSTTSDITKNTTELENIRKKIAEINNYDGVKITNENQLRILKEQEASLERQLEIDKERARLANIEYTKKAESQLNKEVTPLGYSRFHEYTDKSFSMNSFEFFGVTKSEEEKNASKTRKELLFEETEQIIKHQKELDKLLQRKDNLTNSNQTESVAYKNLLNDIEEVTNARDKSAKRANEYATQIENITTGMNEDSKTYKENIDVLNYYSDAVKKVKDSNESYGLSSDKIVEENNETAESAEEVLNVMSSLSEVLSNQDISKGVTAYENGIKKITENLDKLDEISQSPQELANLFTTFPDFDWSNYNIQSVDGLREALSKLADHELEKVLDLLSRYPSANGLIKYFTDMKNEIGSIDVNQLSDKLNKMFEKSNSEIIFNEVKIDSLIKKYDKLAEKRKSSENYVGNVDINNRPIVDQPDGSYATSLTGFKEYKNDDGSYQIIHFTPILPDGTILDDDTLFNYLDKIVNSAQGAMSADSTSNGGKGIVYKVDTEIDGEKITDENKDIAFKVADDWDVAMHEIQDKLYRKEHNLLEKIKSYSYDVSKSIEDALGKMDEKTVRLFVDFVDRNGASYNSFEDLLSGFYSSVDTAGITDVITSVDEMSSSFKVLGTVYSEINESGKVSTGSLVSLQKEFKDTDGILDFIKNISVAGITTEQFTEEVNKLMTSYIEHNILQDNLNIANSEFTARLLEAEGVTNALDVVLSQLGLTTNEYTTILQYCKDKGIELIDITDDEIIELMKLESTTEDTRQSLAKYILEKETANGINLDTSADIERLMELITACGGAITALEELAKVKKAYDDYMLFSESKPIGLDTDAFNEKLNDTLGTNIESIEERYNRAVKEANDSIKEILNGNNKKVKANVDGIEDLGKKTEKAGKSAKETKDAVSKLNTEIDNLQSAYKTLLEIVDSYNETGMITIDQYQELTKLGWNYLANLVDENGQLGLNEEAFKSLAEAKVYELQVTMARNAVDTINSLTSEAMATEYLAYANRELADATLSATEAMMLEAVASAHARGKKQGEAAEKIYEGYQALKNMSKNVDFSSASLAGGTIGDKSKSGSVDDENNDLENRKKILELEYERAETTKERNRILREQIALLDEIKQADLKDAKTELDRQVIEEQYLNDVLELTHQIAQNRVDNYQSKLDDLEASKKESLTYQEQNKIINKQIELRKKQYQDELKSVTTDIEKADLLREYLADLDELNNEKLENTITKKEKIAELEQESLTTLENELKFREQLGGKTTQQDYDILIDKARNLQLKWFKLYQIQKDSIEENVRLGAKNGGYDEYSEEWYNSISILGSYQSSIDACTDSILSYVEAQNSIMWDSFEKGISYFDSLKSEYSNLRSMVNGDNLISKNGDITSDGYTAIYLDERQIEINTALIDSYYDAITELERRLKSGTITQDEYNTKLNEYKSAQMGLARDIQSLSKDMRDIQIKSIEAVTNAYKENNSAIIKQIQEQENLRKSQKSTNKENETMAKLQTKIAKLRLSDSKADKATANLLQEKLDKMREDREEQILEDSAQAKIDALNKESEAVETANKEQIDSIKRSASQQKLVVQNLLNGVQDNYMSVMGNIGDLVADYGNRISTDITSPWESGVEAIKRYKDEISSITGMSTSGYSPISSSDNSSHSRIMDILTHGNAKSNENSTSNLNDAIKKKYGNAISYDQMSELASILNLGNWTKEEIKADTSIKNNILSLLQKGNYLDGNDTDTHVDMAKMNKSEIDKILKNGKGSTSKSELNQWVVDKYGNPLDYKQMALIANLMGFNDITKDSIKENASQRDLILRILRNAHFSEGGMIEGDSRVGDNLVTFASKGESILNKLQTKALIDFKPSIPYLKELSNSLINNKLTKGGIENLTLLNIEGDANKDNINDAIERMKAEIIPIINDALR